MLSLHLNAELHMMLMPCDVLLQSQGAAAAGVTGGGLTSASAYAPKEYNKVRFQRLQRMCHGELQYKS